MSLYCPPEFDAVCHKCNRWSAWCIRVWRGDRSTNVCRKCRAKS